MQRRPLLAACKKALPFVAESGSAFSYLLLLKFYGLRSSHSRHFVANYAVLIGKRLGVIAAGENCHIGLVFIIFRFPGVRLIRRGRGIKSASPIEGFGVSLSDTQYTSMASPEMVAACHASSASLFVCFHSPTRSGGVTGSFSGLV